MNTISLDTQKKLMFLPFINLFNLFIYLYNCTCVDIPIGKTLKGGFWALVSVLPIMTIQFVLYTYVPAVGNITGYMVMYFGPMLMSFVLIRYQDSLDEVF